MAAGSRCRNISAIVTSSAWDEFAAKGSIAPETEQRLAQIEQRDNLFQDIDPALWASRKAER
jgi:hypothetical protein